MTAIKNILFDLGGVLYQIDYHLTIKAFEKLGIKEFNKHFSQQQQNQLFDKLETGKISNADFLNDMQKLLPHCSQSQITEAWNALLIDIPQENIDLLKQLSKSYNLYLLSNTNAIHVDRINKLLKHKYDLNSLDPLFTKAYLSHQIGLRKPHVETFKWVLEDARIQAEETLFIEDTLQHINGAKEAGIKTQLWESNKPLSGLFPGKAL
jgi:glucose-1-phosphatase